MRLLVFFLLHLKHASNFLIVCSFSRLVDPIIPPQLKKNTHTHTRLVHEKGAHGGGAGLDHVGEHDLGPVPRRGRREGQRPVQASKGHGKLSATFQSSLSMCVILGSALKASV